MLEGLMSRCRMPFRDGQAVADLGQEVQHHGGRQDALVQGRGQVLAGHVLHHQVELPLVLPEFQDRDDVGMAQPACGLGLMEEAFPGLGGLRPGGMEGLDGHLPPDHGIPGQEHLAHGALAQAPQDLEFPDALFHVRNGIGASILTGALPRTAPPPAGAPPGGRQ
jgi:hypothetical protein